MMRTSLLMILGVLSAASAVQAQTIHKCVVDGRASYQEGPCEAVSVAPAPAPAGAPAAGRAPRAAAVPVQADRESRISAGLPWAGLKAGMRVAEVLALVPDSYEANDGAALQNGARGRIVKHGVRLAGREFKASYFFMGEGLYMVRLDHEHVVDKAERVLTDLGRLKIAMSQRYGAAKVREVPVQRDGLVSGSLEWTLANGDRVVLTALPVSAGAGMLHLGFVPGTAAQAGLPAVGGTQR